MQWWELFCKGYSEKGKSTKGNWKKNLWKLEFHCKTEEKTWDLSIIVFLYYDVGRNIPKIWLDRFTFFKEKILMLDIVFVLQLKLNSEHIFNRMHNLF